MSYNYLDSKFKKNLLNHNSQYYREYKYSFGDLIELLDKNILKKPVYQCNINEDKVNEMLLSYKVNPEFFYFKNKLVFCYIPSKKNNIYIVDGQHRIELIKKLYELNYDNYVYICCYIITDEEKMRLLYEELNKDSYKNVSYVFLDDFSKNIHNKFVEYLEDNYSLYFDKKQKKDSYKRTISEFLSVIEKKNYLLKFNSFEELKEDFENANFSFNSAIKYNQLYTNSSKIFYKDEQDSVSNGITFTLRNNNFIEYLLDRSVIPEHKFKKEKKRITKKLKKEVWVKEYGNKKSGKCPYKNCVNTIFEDDYSCGHIISEFNGGPTTIDNLRPMCYRCNNKLGKRNWI